MKRFLAIVSVLGLLAFASSAAWGRAGGGHSYSGGSHSSSASRSSSSSGWHSSGSSYHSSSSSSGELSGGSCCMVALIVLVVLVAMAVQAYNKNKSNQQTSGSIDEAAAQRRAANRQADQQRAEGLAKIAARDPSFKVDDFLKEAQRLFVQMQQAWSQGNFDAVRRGMSDGVLRRFTTQVALNRFHGLRNVTAGVRVLNVAVVGVEADDDFDTLHVRLTAYARDCDVPANTPDAVAYAKAAREPEAPFVEYWSFVRRLTPDLKGGRLSEGKCPSCGAPVPSQATVVCEYCKAILNSGTYDWVLSEITQAEEFEMRPQRPGGGFARLKATDPAANRQVLEDRACLVFWKWIEAQATGQPKRFARLCTSAALNEMLSLSGKPVQGLAKTAVGSVELAHVESDADYDRAAFAVRWSTTGAGTGLVRSSMLTLARRAGIKTSAKTGLATDRCHNCAAPQPDGDRVECSHCGSLLSQDWAFEELAPVEAWQARRRTSNQAADGLAEHVLDIADPFERRRALSVMVAMARADGVVTESEHRLLRTCAKRWGIDPVDLQALLAAPAAELTELQPKSRDEAKVLYRALVSAALVDGRIDAEERKLLLAMAAHLQLPQEEAQAIVREMKDASDQLRQG
ncbi:MAG: TIM44-like domain-containing protein [Myxococcales bacterium]